MRHSQLHRPLNSLKYNCCDKGKKGHSYEVDIWSTGVITYALLFGKPPFETNEVKLTYERIKVCDFSFPKLVVS